MQPPWTITMISTPYSHPILVILDVVNIKSVLDTMLSQCLPKHVHICKSSFLLQTRVLSINNKVIIFNIFFFNLFFFRHKLCITITVLFRFIEVAIASFKMTIGTVILPLNVLIVLLFIVNHR